MNLKNKIVVITGASKGLGRAMAIKFAQEKAQVIISSRSKSNLIALAKKIQAVPYLADVTQERQVNNLAKAAIKKFKRIDIWINNAGVWIPHAPIEKLNNQRLRKMLEVNLFGLIYGSRAALIPMKKQKSGTIINILSTSALTGRAGSAGYCASKYAALGFAKSLRLEAQPKNIQVISIYPGGMQTNFFDEKKPKNYHEYMNPDLVAQKIVKNLEKQNPKDELIIKRKSG